MIRVIGVIIGKRIIGNLDSVVVVISKYNMISEIDI